MWRSASILAMLFNASIHMMGMESRTLYHFKGTWIGSGIVIY